VRRVCRRSCLGRSGLEPMGNSPSAPAPQTARRLKRSYTAICREASAAIGEADVLMLLTGAGFSADSGLVLLLLPVPCAVSVASFPKKARCMRPGGIR
jgi:hypothetical protein